MNSRVSDEVTFFPERELMRNTLAKLRECIGHDITIKEIDDLRWLGEQGTRDLSELMDRLPEDRQSVVAFLLASATSELVLCLKVASEQLDT